MWHEKVISVLDTYVDTSTNIITFRVTELENMGHLGRGVDRRHIQNMVEKLAYSDWLILYYLAQVRLFQISLRT